jgi:hypothetical protein
MISLDAHVRWAIWNYPTLFRCDNYKDSRLEFMEHMFLTNGNGYEWAPEGYMMAIDSNKSTIQKAKKLPSNYFDMNLYILRGVIPEKIEELLDFLSDRFHYMLSKKWNNQKEVVFEANSQKEASEITDKYTQHKMRNFEGIEMSDRMKYSNAEEARNRLSFSPYPICQYAAISEIMLGKTTGNDEGFNFIPQPDYLQGCIEVAEEALKYYNTEESYKNNFYHPSKTLHGFKYDIKEAHAKGKKAAVEKNLKDGETIEEFAERIWVSHREEQIKILSKFLNKYRN